MVRSSASTSYAGDNGENHDVDNDNDETMIMTIQSKLSPHISAHIVLQSLRMRKKRKNMN